MDCYEDEVSDLVDELREAHDFEEEPVVLFSTLGNEYKNYFNRRIPLLDCASLKELFETKLDDYFHVHYTNGAHEVEYIVNEDDESVDEEEVNDALGKMLDVHDWNEECMITLTKLAQKYIDEYGEPIPTFNCRNLRAMIQEHMDEDFEIEMRGSTAFIRRLPDEVEKLYNEMLQVHDFDDEPRVLLSALGSLYKKRFNAKIPLLGYPSLKQMIQNKMSDHFQIVIDVSNGVHYVECVDDGSETQNDDEESQEENASVDDQSVENLMDELLEAHDFDDEPVVLLSTLGNKYKDMFNQRIPLLGCSSLKNMFENILDDHFRIQYNNGAHEVEYVADNEVKELYKELLEVHDFDEEPSVLLSALGSKYKRRFNVKIPLLDCSSLKQMIENKMGDYFRITQDLNGALSVEHIDHSSQVDNYEEYNDYDEEEDETDEYDQEEDEENEDNSPYSYYHQRVNERDNKEYTVEQDKQNEFDNSKSLSQCSDGEESVEDSQEEDEPAQSLVPQVEISTVSQMIYEAHEWCEEASITLDLLQNKFKQKFDKNIPLLRCDTPEDMFQKHLSDDYRVLYGLSSVSIECIAFKRMLKDLTQKLKAARQSPEFQSQMTKLVTSDACDKTEQEDKSLQTEFATSVDMSRVLLNDGVIGDVLGQKYPILKQELLTSLEPLSPDRMQITDRRSTAIHINEIGIGSTQTDVTPEDDLMRVVATDEDIMKYIIFQKPDLLLKLNQI